MKKDIIPKIQGMDQMFNIEDDNKPSLFSRIIDILMRWL